MIKWPLLLALCPAMLLTASAAWSQDDCADAMDCQSSLSAAPDDDNAALEDQDPAIDEAEATAEDTVDAAVESAPTDDELDHSDEMAEGDNGLDDSDELPEDQQAVPPTPPPASPPLPPQKPVTVQPTPPSAQCPSGESVIGASQMAQYRAACGEVVCRDSNDFGIYYCRPR